MMVKKYHYAAYSNTMNAAQLTDEFNKMLREGWEIDSIDRTGPMAIYVLYSQPTED